MRDIFEMTNDSDYDVSLEEEASFEKVAFDLNTAASMLIGFKVGNKAGQAIGEEQGKLQSLRNSDLPTLEGDYYSQVENISKNLKILFSPISVIYTLEDKGKRVTLDVIETSEMDENMRNAFNNKNKNYFKNLFINKMQLETQYAEMFNAKKLLTNFKNVSSKITGQTKKASTLYETNMEVIALQDMYKNAGHKLQELIEKTAQNIETPVTLQLERPISDYSELGNYEIFKIAKLTDFEYRQKNLLDRNYIIKNLRVGFVGNRVVYTIDDNIVAQLSTLNMTPEGFTKFKSKDTNFFKKLFLKQSDKTGLVKQASVVTNAKDLFSDSKVPIKTYYALFNKKYGTEWINFDTEEFIKIIELYFNLEKPIPPIVLDKMFTLQNICSTNDCLENAFIFEKTCRTVNDKPVDFSEYEYNLTAVELMKALQIIDELTPNNDIFDDFTEEVMTYLTKALVVADCRCITPNRKIISSDLEEKFFQTLNGDLNYRWATMNPIEKQYQSVIQPFVASVVNIVRKAGKYTSDAIDLAMEQVSKSFNIQNERVLSLSRNNVVINLSLDIVLDKYDQESEESIKNLEL